jgi:hypothetical protein
MPERLYQEEKQKAVNVLNDLKIKLYNKGFFPATSGNLSTNFMMTHLYLQLLHQVKIREPLHMKM